MRVAEQVVRCNTEGEMLEVVESEGRFFLENGSGSCWIDMGKEVMELYPPGVSLRAEALEAEGYQQVKALVERRMESGTG